MWIHHEKYTFIPKSYFKINIFAKKIWPKIKEMTFSQFNENYKMGATIQSLNQDYTKARKFSHYFLTSKDCKGSIILFLRLHYDGNSGVEQSIS